MACGKHVNDKDLNGYRNEGKEPGEGEGDGRRYPVDGAGGVRCLIENLLPAI